MCRKYISALFALFISAVSAFAAPRSSDFKDLCDSLTSWTNERMGVVSKVELSKVLRRGNMLDFYFGMETGEYPWRKDDIRWFKETVRDNLPQGYFLGEIFVRSLRLDEHSVPAINNTGVPVKIQYSHESANSTPTVYRTGERKWQKGLYGRHIALWQSHGRYYDAGTRSWKWQRAVMNRTVEDIYTRSYVLKYLMPMLENAGANVFTPRERDIQPMEYVMDNDPSFKGERAGMMRRVGLYSEKGSWNSSAGFADTKCEYSLDDNPFKAGTSRYAFCSDKGNLKAIWTADIFERGHYAVYVSYESTEHSCPAANYTVRHLGGETSFTVDQRRGGGTWIYLGTFEFGPGTECCVTLTNKGRGTEVVSADAVRIGGGMGKVARADAGVSGMPAASEGALYSMVWSGAGPEITGLWNDDYTNDFADRGPWTQMLRDDKDIPVDMSLGFHSDAGATPNDSIVGTLAIYTLQADGKRLMKDGTDRSVCRTLTDFVQSQVVGDIRASFDSEWSRRQVWNRSYSECRNGDVPSMLLELLSHQNFADMRYGLDPAFQFTAARGVYKGILKFLSSLYDTPYAVQPLPVKDFAVSIEDGKAVLSWKPTVDSLEPTAVAKGYRVYTRVDDGAFDNGRDFTAPKASFDMDPGHIYSFKVAAWNDGGLGFPSEILCAGCNERDYGSDPVLIVNNFTRVCGPTWIDSPMFAGFDGREDSGVPYINDISYAGEVYDFRRYREWHTNDDSGCGASFDDHASETVAGNTFDYPYIHGKALMELGFSFCSMSASAFAADCHNNARVLDLICGKQVTTMVGRGEKPSRYKVFPVELREALRSFADNGGDMIVSGADIATDAWSDVYPLQHDQTEDADCQEFIKTVLGYKFVSDHGTNSAFVDGMEFWNRPNSVSYCVENPDAIGPASKSSHVIMRYDGSSRPAAVMYEGEGYKVASYGFPLEVLKSSEDIKSVLSVALGEFGL